MNTKDNIRGKALTEEEIDMQVEAQANDDEAWEESITVRGKGKSSLSIPVDLAKRAAFLARLHKGRDVEEWLTQIIKERVELEESAFVEIKKALSPEQRA